MILNRQDAKATKEKPQRKAFLRALRAFAVKKKNYVCLNRKDAKIAKGKAQRNFLHTFAVKKGGGYANTLSDRTEYLSSETR